jgi:hypothetical protein
MPHKHKRKRGEDGECVLPCPLEIASTLLTAEVTVTSYHLHNERGLYQSDLVEKDRHLSNRREGKARAAAMMTIRLAPSDDSWPLRVERRSDRG